MNKIAKLAAVALLASLAVPAFAAPGLTPKQCNDYPFAKLRKPVTHRQLVNELVELEAVGYDPATSDDDDYPTDLQQAEAKLQTEYRQDCLPTSHQSAATATPSTATNVAQQ